MIFDVIAIGGINHDLVLNVARAPAPGETVLAKSLARRSGGKGANQAAAAARAGARVALLSAVGVDAIGACELQALRAVGVNVSGVACLNGVPTGLAAITVSSDGENRIVVAAGANAHVDPAAIEGSLARLCSSETLVVLQTELPKPVVEAAARYCALKGLRVLINNGPCVDLSEDATRVANPLVVNHTEAVQMIGLDAPSDPRMLAARLHQQSGAKSVVLTLGGQGSVWLDSTGSQHVPAEKAEVVDTTGAGDAFIGTLAACLARHQSLSQACAAATSAGAIAVTWQGARPE